MEVNDHLPVIRVEHRYIVPRITEHWDVTDVNTLLTRLKECCESNCRCLRLDLSETGASKYGNLMWTVSLEPDPIWLEYTREKGKCGLCDNDIPAHGKLPEPNKIYQRGKICCDYCGRVLVEDYAEPTLADVFNSCTKHVDVLDSRVLKILDRK